MPNKSKLRILILTLAIVAVTIFPTAIFAASPVTAVTINLPSGLPGSNGETTQTAGFTGTDPTGSTVSYVSNTTTLATGPLSAAPGLPLNLSTFAWSNAQIIPNPNGAWTSIAGANWISTTASNQGIETANEGDSWRIFKATFDVSSTASITSANLQIAADNAYAVFLNGNTTPAATTEGFSPTAPVFGSATGSSTTAPFNTAASYNLSLTTGSNTLIFVVRNWDNNGSGNPSGLIYKVNLAYVQNNQLTPGSYNGTWVPASIIDSPNSNWVTLSGARWVSTTSLNSGVEAANEGDAWRLFKEDFTVPAKGSDPSGSIQIAADNAFEVYLNGTLLGSSADFSPSAPVYGPQSGSGSQTPFHSLTTYTFTPRVGANTLMFVVRNWDNNSTANPSGLLYNAVIHYNLPFNPANVWWLNEIDHNTVTSQLEMEKILDIQTGSVALASGASEIWLADQAAQSEVTFPIGVWTLSLHTDQDWGKDCAAVAGEWDTANSKFIPLTTVKSTDWDGISKLTILLDGSTINIHTGNYLALQITNNNSGKQTIVTDYTLNGSYLAPPEGSPGYPTPEWSTIILLGLGLTGLGSFLLIRKKKAARANIAI